MVLLIKVISIIHFLTLSMDLDSWWTLFYYLMVGSLFFLLLQWKSKIVLCKDEGSLDNIYFVDFDNKFSKIEILKIKIILYLCYWIYR